MKRIYSIISLLLFAIIAMGQNVRPSLIYSDNPNMLEVDANGGRFTYRYRIFEANPDNIQNELEVYLQEKRCDWLTVVDIIPDDTNAAAGNILFEAAGNYTGAARKCLMMSALPIRIYLITQASSVAPLKTFKVSAPRTILPGHDGTLNLSGSEQGVTYSLYLDGSLIESKQGTGSPLNFRITQPGLYAVEGIRTDGLTSKMGEVLVDWQNINLYDKGRNYMLEKVYTKASSVSDSSLCVRNLTYTDGFGRNLQEIQIGASPSGKGDLVSVYEYGVMGRTEKAYLPYEKTGNWGAYVVNAYATNNWDIYGTTDAAYAFTKTEYDGSPLNRITRRTEAGKAWHTNEKGQGTTYALNLENEVRLYEVDLFSGSLSLSGYYSEGALQKTIVTDEDGHQVESFTDSADKTVLTVMIDGEKRLETYYVYDDREQLRWVLSPEASYQLGNTVHADVLNKLAYYYGYDRLGRVIEKRLPGCDPIYMVYDKRDRMVLSQDGNQRAADSKKWSYSVYDNNSRVVESGEMVLSVVASHKQLQDAAWNVENYQPAAIKTPLQYTVYGSYEATAHVTPKAFVPVIGYASDYHKIVTGLVTSTKTRILGTDTWLTATTYYDEKCRTVQTISDNQHGTLSTVNTVYDFVGNVLKQRETHGNDVLEAVNTYDDRSRLLSATSTLNGGTPAIVSYEYDALGRLITKKYGDKVTEQMAYNIRGWLTSKESEPFKMKLHYEAPVAGATACYNGNISEWEWQQETHTAQLYGFTYDPVSRLKEANQQKKEGSNWITNINHYVEKGITYDRNGNILTLRRTANGTMIDNLLYGYTGNRLTSLIESVRGLIPGDIYQSGLLPNGIYEYDANGNMIKDSRKSLTFNYNALNLLGIVKENNVVKANYRYLADGTKQSIRNGNGDTGYDYDGSFVYTVTNGMSTLDAAHFADGQLKSTGVNYVLTDHLGSVRTLVDANGTILEQNDFYPFGSKHTNEAYASNSSNRFLFSGKERQDLLDLNTYDFGARMYDSSIARWAAVDPLCEDCYSLSLYNYCGNNPISFVDFFGMDYWSTSNPALISLFLNTIRQGDANVYGRSSISFNLSAWEHLTDNDFIAGLSYNDETGMFYWNTANIVNGEWIITGHSLSNRIYGLPAIKDNQLHFSYYNENKALSASGKLDNNDLDFQILTLGRLKATEVSIALTQSLISRIWRPKYTLESLISKVSTHTRTGDPQAFVKGDAYKIFQQVIKTGKNTGDNQYLMPDGTTVKLYKASSNGLPTIFIDKGVVKYKIRITQ